MHRLFNLSLLILIILTVSCSDSKDGEKESSGLLPRAGGDSGEIVLLMDSAQWKGSLGDTIRSIFMKDVQGLNRDEPMFSLKYVDPRNLTSLLKQATNLLYITTFDKRTAASRYIQRLFTQESLDKIKDNPDYFLTTSKDVYAKGQDVLYLFGPNEEALVANLVNNQARLIDFFNRVERARMEKELFNKENSNIRKAIGEKIEGTVRVPEDYQLALLRDKFAWVRYMEYEIDKNVWIAYTDYYNESQFTTEEIIKFRDKICKQYLYEDKENMPDSYLMTETEVPFIPVISRQINLNNHFAVETRGLWRTYNHSMGGPFVGITVADEATNRLYYIEGFAYSPGKPQREIIRELQTILFSFKSIQDNSPKSDEK